MGGPRGKSAGGQGQPPPDVSVIVPCLNEEQNIPSVIDKLVRLTAETRISSEILIVDDCSDDYTFREAMLLSARYPNVQALHKGLPRGIGSAIRYGIDHASGRVGVVVMGDGVDPLAAIPEFCTRVTEHGDALVLLSRYLEPEHSRSIPLTYRFYQRIYRFLCRWGAGLQVRDPTYAFRGFDLAFVRSLGLNSIGFEISPEITLKTWLSGGRIHELPGQQGRRIAGESKFVFSRQAYGYARVWLRSAATYQMRRFSLTRTHAKTAGSRRADPG
jgi:dolichol-phosphate mannosyltransferase